MEMMMLRQYHNNIQKINHINRKVFMKKTILAISLSTLLISANATDIQVGFSGAEQGNTAISVVLGVINSANTSIDVLAYSFSNKEIIKALINAKKRGVNVRVIADYNQNNKSYSGLTTVSNAGIEAKTNSNYQDFHNKVMIIDNNCVETGSFNYSASAVYKNAENAIYFCDSNVAQQYSTNFNYWWNQGVSVK